MPKEKGSKFKSLPKPANPLAKISKFKRLKIPIAIKQQIIEKQENGVSVVDLAREYNRTTSTICTILKDKARLKTISVSEGVARRSEKRSKILDDVERLLLIWLKEKRLQGEHITQNIICEKAKQMFDDLVQDMPTTSTSTEKFKASNGWFDRFKTRTGIHNVMRHWDAASSDRESSNGFIEIFKDLVQSGNYLPQQIFSCGKTELFWNAMPDKVKPAAGQNTGTWKLNKKHSLDRVALLLCANASGDSKIKPLLVYNSKHSQTHEIDQAQKDQIELCWSCYKTAWITRDNFVDWINHVFCPSVKRYLIEQNLPLHALFVMEDVLFHPENMDYRISEEFKFVRFLFLPPETAPLLLPMNQQIICDFKKLYMETLFEYYINNFKETFSSLAEFLKHHFSIVTSFKIIGMAWEEVTQGTLISAWKKLWPDMECYEAAEIEAHGEPTVDRLVKLANSLGLQKQNKDMEELVGLHMGEPSSAECLNLQTVDLKANPPAATNNLDKPESTEEIETILKAWDTVSSYVLNHHPDAAIALQAYEVYETNAMSHFRAILEQRHKQIIPKIK